MSTNSKIEWTEATWNPVTGCTKVSPGCDHCYAERITERFHGPGSFARVQMHADRLTLPTRWRKPRRVFVNSMSDLFHDSVPDEYIIAVFGIMAQTPKHTYQVLTKRHARMRSLLNSAEVRQRFCFTWPLPNVWLGVSVEDQKWADIRIPALLETPAAVRFLSCEPLLGPVNLIGQGGDLVGAGVHALPDPPPFDGMDPVCQDHGAENCTQDCRFVDWVIAGGESGPAARPMHPAWVRSLRDQCEAAHVPFFFKQWGEYLPAAIKDDATMFGGRAYSTRTGARSAPVIRTGSGPFRAGVTRLMEPGDRTGAGVLLDRDTIALRIGKHKAGRELDGRTWDEYPVAS